MAENEVDEKEGAAEKPRSGSASDKLLKLLLGIAILFVMIGSVWMASYYFSRANRAGSLPVEPGMKPGIDAVTEPPLAYDMNKFTVIIFDEGGRSYNLRVHILLTVNSERPDNQQATQELIARKDQLTDAIYEVLIAMKPRSFMGTESERSQGLAELKASIIRAVNARMKHRVDGCFLKEFIFQ